MTPDLHDILDWATLAAAVTGAIIPVVIYAHQATAPRRALKRAWSLTLQAMPDLPNDVVRAELKLEDADEHRLRLLSVDILKPAGAVIGRRNPRQWQGLEQLEFGPTIETGVTMRKDQVLQASGNSTFPFLVRLPQSILYQRTSTITVLVTLEEISSRRRKVHLKIVSQVMVMPQSSTASMK